MSTQLSEPRELRQDIASSWLRSELAGLVPEGEAAVRIGDFDEDSRLVRSADAVFARLESELAGNRIGFMLIDSRARLVRTASAMSSVRNAIEGIGGVSGAEWTERSTGTNGLSTPFETRSPLFIHGDEHYLESMKAFSCYGAPIFHPITGRVEGVLDIMVDRSEETALMAPVVNDAIRRIQDGLWSDRRDAYQQMMAEFAEVDLRSSSPVVAVHRDRLVQNAQAGRLLTPVDLEQLRALTAEIAPGFDGAGATSEAPVLRIDLQNGAEALVRVRGAGDGTAVLTLERSDRGPVPRKQQLPDIAQNVHSAAERIRAVGGSVLIAGEAGTGRTTMAHFLLGGESPTVIQAGAADAGRIERVLHELMTNEGRTRLIIEDLEILPESVLRTLDYVIRSRGPQIIATANSARLAAVTNLVPSFAHRLDLPRMREMRHDLAGTIGRLRPDRPRPIFDTAAASALASYDWPGNFSELGALLDSLAPIAEIRQLRLADLPQHIRQSTMKPLTPWQRAGFETLREALDLHHGNKSHAAEYLGISRSALYHHMREYGMS